MCTCSQVPTEVMHWKMIQWMISCLRHLQEEFKCRILKFSMRGLLEGTHFGQSRFGHPDLTNFGQSIFGHLGFGRANFGQIQFWPIQFLANSFQDLVSWPKCGAPKPKKMGPRRVGPRRVGSPKGGEPKFLRFFFPSLATIFALFCGGNPELTVLSIDGVGACDHVFRSARLSKIWEVPALRPLLPFVRSVCARLSSYVWTDDEGQCDVIRQMEGGEQDDLFELLEVKLASAGIRLQERRGVGIEAVCLPTTCQNLGPDVWSPHCVKILGPRLDQRNSLKRPLRGGWRKNRFCGRDTVSARHTVRLANPSTVCRAKVSPMVENGPTQLFSHVRCGARRWYDEHNGRTVWRTSGMRASKRWPTRWHHCRCGWEAWGCDRLRAWRLRLIGCHGRTHCP